jgi:hypothetical protein
MAQNYDLNQTGPELQERIDQVFPNRDNIAAEGERAQGAEQELETVKATREELQAETARAQAAEHELESSKATRTELQAENSRATEKENNLQAQIDAIVSKDTTVGLSVSPAAVFADGTDKVVTFVATSSPTKATVVFDGGEPREGTRLEYEVTVNSATPTTVTKTAQFTVQGVSKGSKSATVALVFPIYYGAGQSADVLNTDAMTAHSAVASPAFIQSITTADNDFIFFEVPEGMANIQRLQLWDDPSFPTDLSIEAVETPREGYKAFKTVNSRLAGTHTYKVS